MASTSNTVTFKLPPELRRERVIDPNTGAETVQVRNIVTGEITSSPPDEPAWFARSSPLGIPNGVIAIAGAAALAAWLGVV